MLSMTAYWPSQKIPGRGRARNRSRFGRHDLAMRGYPSMNVSSRSTIVVSLVSALSLLACAAQAQQQPPQHNAPPPNAPPPHVKQGRPPAPVAGRGQPTARVYAGNPYRGRGGWGRGGWRHEIHKGREGGWWDVGGVWSYPPQQLGGPPPYISEDSADDVYPAAGGYAPPPPAYVAA